VSQTNGVANSKQVNLLYLTQFSLAITAPPAVGSLADLDIFNASTLIEQTHIATNPKPAYAVMIHHLTLKAFTQ
jgi:hypothetical protein